MSHILVSTPGEGRLLRRVDGKKLGLPVIAQRFWGPLRTRVVIGYYQALSNPADGDLRRRVAPIKLPGGQVATPLDA